jgi:multidrug resistance efflux pump
MSGYMLAKISGQLGQMANQMRVPSGQPGVSISDYNDLVHRANALRENEAYAVNQNTSLRDQIQALDAKLTEWQVFGREMKDRYERSDNLATRAIAALDACENANDVLRQQIASLKTSLELASSGA